MEQQVIKIGNSAGVIIPKKLLKALGWKVGTKLLVTWDNDAGTVIYRRKKEIANWLKKHSRKI